MDDAAVVAAVKARVVELATEAGHSVDVLFEAKPLFSEVEHKVDLRLRDGRTLRVVLTMGFAHSAEADAE